MKTKSTTWWENASRDEIHHRQDALLRRFLRDRVVPFTTHYGAMFRGLGMGADEIRGTGDLVKLLSVLELAIILEPGAADEIRDRARVYLRLECFTQARAGFESYLQLAPEAKDATAVRDQLVDLANRVTLIH